MSNTCVYPVTVRTNGVFETKNHLTLRAQELVLCVGIVSFSFERRKDVAPLLFRFGF
jgi:hypothetical protein